MNLLDLLLCALLDPVQQFGQSQREIEIKIEHDRETQRDRERYIDTDSVDRQTEKEMNLLDLLLCVLLDPVQQFGQAVPRLARDPNEQNRDL